ncbi:hypothetical protein D3C76_1329870 [compost metagenome]
MEHVHACILVGTSDIDGVVDIVSTIRVFYSRNPQNQRHICRHFFFHCPNDFNAKTGQILPIYILTMVHQRRMELVDQVSMCTVQFNGIYSSLYCAANTVCELLHHSFYLFRA